jgi:hypothetical protein
MLISTALLLDSIIRNSVCTPAKLPCRRVEVGYEKTKLGVLAHFREEIGMQKPYAPKCRQGKTKIDLFRDFLQKSSMSKLRILFQLKFPHCIHSPQQLWHNNYRVIINDCTIVGGCAQCFRCAATPTSCYKHL